MIAVQQLVETLKLVHDDQVRLERVDTDVREQAAKAPDDGVASLDQIAWVVVATPVEVRAQIAKFGQNPRG